MKKLLTIIIASLTLSSCSTSTPATKTIAPTTPATQAATAPTTMPPETTTPKTVAVSTTATVQEDYPSQVLEIFKETYQGLFEVKLDGSDYIFTSAGEAFNSVFEDAVNNKKDAIDSINSLANSLAETTEMFLEEYKNYSVSVINPINAEKVLLVVKDGVIEYNFLDESENGVVSTETDSVDQQILNVFKEIYGKEYDIQLEDENFYLQPMDDVVIQGINLAIQEQEIGINFWNTLKDNFNLVSSEFPEEVKDYTITLKNPVDSTRILFISKNGETVYDALNE